MWIPLTKKKLLAVEGMDEVVFFEELLRHMGMTDKIDVRQVGGKDQFKIKLPVLQKITGFDKLETVGIIRDADESFERAFESVKGVLQKMGLQVPVRSGDFSKGIPGVGIFIMPDNAGKGMLEDLCLQTVKGETAMECVKQFIDCAGKLKNKPKNISRAKAQAFLTIMPEIASSVGRGAQKRYWDFESAELKPLLHFLSRL
jgi:hypothetical protein